MRRAMKIGIGDIKCTGEFSRFLNFAFENLAYPSRPFS